MVCKDIVSEYMQHKEDVLNYKDMVHVLIGQTEQKDFFGYKKHELKVFFPPNVIKEHIFVMSVCVC